MLKNSSMAFSAWPGDKLIFHLFCLFNDLQQSKMTIHPGTAQQRPIGEFFSRLQGCWKTGDTLT
jgi:hypothetical protein